MADLAKTDITGMESAGRVVPLYKGDYSNTVSYQVLDVVLYNNSSYIAKQTTKGHTPPSTNSDAYWQLIAKGIIDADVSNSTATFTEASTRVNIASGETIKTILGKIKKWITDLKPVAFSGSYNDLSNKPTIPSVGNGTLTIQKNGTNVKTFTANQSGDVTANITVPTSAADVGAVETSKVLTTKEQINANTDPTNVASATAVKSMVSEVNGNLGEINNVKQSSNQSIAANTWIKILSLTLGPGTYVIVGQLSVSGKQNTSKYIAIVDANMNAHNAINLILTQLYGQVTTILTITNTQTISVAAHSIGEQATVSNGVLTALKIK